MSPRCLSILCLLLVCPVVTMLAAPQTPRLAGEVRTKDGPLAGARVRFQGDATSVITDNKGSFLLPVVEKRQRITAWKDGFFIAGAAHDADPLRLTLRPLPRHDNGNYRWVDPAPDPDREKNCANCHGEIYREWNDSGHAHSATSRQFRDLYLGTGGGWSLIKQHPLGIGVCAACHAPTVAAGDPALADLSKVQDVSSKGVHCDYCHKVTGLREKPDGLTHGRDQLQILRPSEGQLFFGPLDDVDRGEDAFSPFYKDSKYCSVCHEGVVFGVHVYSTYSEWLESPAGKRGQSCQDCHMKPTGKMTNFAPGKGGIERDPLTLGNHRFFAGSREKMLRDSLRVDVRSQHKDGKTNVEVNLLADGVGHRVPTGFIDRHLLLVVEAKTAEGRTLDLLAGPKLESPAGKALAGMPGYLFAKLLRNDAGQSPAPFWDANPEPRDTRLVPGKNERISFQFAGGARTVRIRVLHRRFWDEVTRTKGWPANELTIYDKEHQPK